MKPLSIATKLTLSNLSYGLPVVILIYLMLGVYQDNIHFAEWERKGNNYQIALQKLFELVGKHSALHQRALHGDSAAKASAQKLNDGIESALTEIDKVQGLYGEDLSFTTAGLAQRKRERYRPETLHADWKEINSGFSEFKPEVSVEKHATFIADIKNMITHLGDTSNLILDPDLDSYYLMDVTLLALPQMQERLTDIATRGEIILRGKKLSLDDRKWAITSAAMLKQSDFDRISGDVQTALNEDKNFNGVSPTLALHVPPAVTELGKNTDEVLKVLNEIADSDGKNLPDAQKFVSLAEATSAASFNLWNVSAAELETLLRIRTDVQVGKKNQSLIYSLIALLFATVISTALGISIRNGVVQSISDIVERMRKIAAVVSESNRRLVITSGNLASGTNRQASAIQETVSTLDEISSMTEKSAHGAQNSAGEAKASQDAAMDGKKSVESLVNALQEIHHSSGTMIDKVAEGNQRILEIVSVIQEIGNKTKVINEIVFQTKLLSFNASVEAARAGEHGKGFAVVAQEVGNLAEMSGNASKEITSLLDQSTTKVNAILDQTKQNLDAVVNSTRSKMDAGMRIAGECGATLDLTVEKVGIVTGLMSEIASATREQAVGVSEIGKAMNLLDQTTQENSASAEESAGLARELEEQANVLLESISDLEKRIGYQSKHTPSESPSNVVAFTARNNSQSSPLYKRAAGDGLTPNESHPGFEDV